jgi:alkanesulfonate monooxygenase SsuD/methylene tetrahydromethanopterin reductase-like flavin-dependent oxidoreductase (luciferase family)
MAVMDAGVHLPLIDFGGEGFSCRRLTETVDAARTCGFGAVSANDHFLFSAPWLDGLTALAAVVERSGGMKLVTTVALAALRGPVPLAKALSALDVLSVRVRPRPTTTPSACRSSSGGSVSTRRSS